MIKLYRHSLSGHAHRVELFLSLIGQPFEAIDVDLLQGEQKQESFLALNPMGQVPVIDDDGTVIADSNAILTYLALTYADDSWYPRDAKSAAAIQRWFSAAAGEINNGPGAARLVTVFGAGYDHDQTKAVAKRLFDVVEAHLTRREFLIGDGPTVADIASYTYIAHAPEGDVSLEPYPNLRAWLARVEALPGFVPMQATKIALAA